ncbi:hypothetical protein H2248_003861 [Termitomyces sp. 'cryptogamus']|nr:hypothetical protein H2248_003861 [Termitomyces sp. 'cryptogamus']
MLLLARCTRPPTTTRLDHTLLWATLAKAALRQCTRAIMRWARHSCSRPSLIPHYHLQDTRQQVAIKTVKRDSLTAKLFDNLQSEIQILKSLSHRHITRLIDIVRAERNIYLIMEYCGGGDLTNYIKKRGRVEGLEYVPEPGAALQYYPHPRTGGLDEIVVRSFLRQLARALKFLRHRNLIHRDIKPQNLLLNAPSPEELARGHPLGVPILKVADFGFARSLPNAVMAETLCGSPLYMAPEILRYEKYDAKADLWSVGAVLYEMSVGKPPFRAQNHIELLKKIEQARGVKFPDEEVAGGTRLKHTGSEKKNGVEVGVGGGGGVIPNVVGAEEPRCVPEDIKKLVRMLLKRNPVERATFEEFFGSEALANSRFPRPEIGSSGGAEVRLGASGQNLSLRNGGAVGSGSGRRERDDGWMGGRPSTPEHHKIIPPEVLDMNAMIPPSRFNFRRGTGAREEGPPNAAVEVADATRGKEMGRVWVNEGRKGGRQPKPLSTEGSYIPGETEEDGMLRREYVLVGDTRAVEVSRTVDEINAEPRRPLYERKIPPTPTTDEFAPFEGTAGPSSPSTKFANPNPSSSSPSNCTAPAPITFPPPPRTSHSHSHPSPPAPPLSSSPSSIASRAASNALNKALNLASKKLFGGRIGAGEELPLSGGGMGSGSGSGASVLALASNDINTNTNTNTDIGMEMEKDPLEEEMLKELEELAQKTDVLTRWADEMYEYVKAVPQKPLSDPTKFTPREGEGDRHAKRRQLQVMEAEYNAVTCVAVYMLLMSFSQKGINRLRNHQEHMKMRYPEGGWVCSEGFDDALGWFKDHFIKCNDRAALVKTWLPVQYDGPKSWLDQLVYDRALVLSRTAARKELLDSANSPDECEKLYEESLWCLYALQDDLLQVGNPFMEEDRETIATWIKRTKLRLVRCRTRMNMNDRDRINDARADQNLADVARIPAPWDVKPTQDTTKRTP